jgi:trans-2,3-dihydro-3-hydroxyanthranilate isomerase
VNLDYHLLDVFTDTAYTGNPLAVFVDAPPLTTAQMQAIAGELNLSETVFTCSPATAGGAWLTRIFTPSTELPFAGHPTVGTAVLLMALGLLDSESVVLDEGIGDVPVVLAKTGNVWGGTLTTATLPEPVDVARPEHLADALGLAPDDLHRSLPTAGWSCGVPVAVVPVGDLDALARCRVDSGAFEAHVADTTANQLYAVTPVDGDLARWRVRMFAPAFGITEDPATGSAAAAFGGYLAALEHAGSIDRFELTQGVEMGRRSRIDLAIERASGAVRAVRVGGQAIVVGSGTLAAPLVD